MKEKVILKMKSKLEGMQKQKQKKLEGMQK